MAYMSQEHKKEIAPVIKAICKEYGIKATLSVRHHSTLCLNIKSGKLDFGDTRQVNPYWLENNYEGRVLEFLQKAKAALYGPRYYDNSEPMTDYFDTSHYIEINVGKYDKPYELTV